MLRIIATVSLVVCVSPLAAEGILDDLRDDVQAMRERQSALHGFDGAAATMEARISGFALAPGTGQNWANWMALEFSKIDDVFDQAEMALSAWESAIGRGEVDVSTARTALSQPMRRLASAEGQIQDGFGHFASLHVGRAMWTAKARSLNAYSQCFEYRSALDAAQDYLDASYAALPAELATAALLPMPGPRADVELATLVQASLPPGAAPRSAFAHNLRSLDHALASEGVPITDPLRGALGLAATQAEAIVVAPAQPLQQAPSAPGSSHASLIQEAEIQTLNQIGSILPSYLAARSEAGVLSTADVRRAADFAQRVAQLIEDVNDPMGTPSRFLRSLTGLRAAARILEMAEHGPDARAMSATVRDINAALSPITPYTAAFAAPQGIATAQISAMAEALNGGADVLRSLGSYVSSGDPRLLQAALTQAREMERTMHPVRILHRAIEGAADGVLSNIPGLRAVMGELLSELLRDLEEAEAAVPTPGYNCQ